MMNKDSREFIALLNSHEVQFLVVGGYAVAFHGHPRWTGDLDLFLRPDEVNARRTLAALGDFGFASLAIAISDLALPHRVVQLGRVPNRIDLLTGIVAVDFDDAWQRRVLATLDGVPVSFLDLDSLLINKGATGREKDKADVEQLCAIRQARGN